MTNCCPSCPKCSTKLSEGVHYSTRYVEYICTNCYDKEGFLKTFAMVDGVLKDPETEKDRYIIRKMQNLMLLSMITKLRKENTI